MKIFRMLCTLFGILNLLVGVLVFTYKIIPSLFAISLNYITIGILFLYVSIDMSDG